VRRAVPFVILGSCLAVGVLPAFAADQSVIAGITTWDPDELAIKPGENVTWNNQSGVVHNLWIDGTKVQPDGSSWTYGPRMFGARDTPYEFHCSLHPGMSGRLYVNDSGTVPTPSPTPSASATPTASPTTTATPTSTAGGGSGGGGSTGGSGTGSTSPTSGSTGGTATPTVTAFRARALRRSFCTRRSATCKKPGVFLVLNLGARDAVRVRGTLKRGARRVRTVTLRVRPGRHRVRLPGRPLRPGRYALTLRAGSFTRKLRFRVRAS
jgi:hypothetical protein